MSDEETELFRGYRDAAEADAAVARLLAQLALTDAEREAITEAAALMSEYWDKDPGPAMVATMRGLLERTK